MVFPPLKATSMMNQLSRMWIMFFTALSASIAVQDNSLCEWGKYGEHCNLTCPVNCALVPPSNLQHCNRDTGECSAGCLGGWHGDLCDQACSATCPERRCNQQTGFCTLGCSGTNMDLFCNPITECGRGWYGDTCEHPCSSNCVEDRCHQTTGVCVLGCRGTYAGEDCNITKETSWPPAAANNKEGGGGVISIRVPVFLAAAITVALVVAVAGAVALPIIVLLRRRRDQNSSQERSTADGEGLLGGFGKHTESGSSPNEKPPIDT
ncbi:multiple epidermal growth factor-like domains protein 10 [Haliotis rubra]|uniref:multiple epidermal growth factor-like domains protein 10 n=1 Tax=Haliotis rubra TaxID=36100 RepID=UPI001EE5CE7F|nr:multiple epidermal growth factor-like domains protein 10 [Haliotis rubra]